MTKQNHMDHVLAEKKAAGKRVLVAYYPLCDPVLGDAVRAAGTYLSAGADVLEMGLPCEEPRLDGATVRASMCRALEAHTLDDAFKEVARIHAAYPEACLQIMSYASIIEQMGFKAFAEAAADAGASAVLTPDLPMEARADFDSELARLGLLSLRFVPYNLTDDMVEDLRAFDAGYLFCQAVDGATGARESVDPHVGENIAMLKEAGFTANCCAGFGVSSGNDVKELVRLGADGVIVGSAIISAACEGSLQAFVQELRRALDAGGAV